jgi:uncharacterized protein (DUF1800 family)
MSDTVDPRWAWEPYRPSAKSPWDLRKVGHLYRRAAFGANWAELQAGLNAGCDETIDAVLKGHPDQASLDEQTRQMAHTVGDANNGKQASAWWLYRMLYSRQPLREKMTLFWHNHFATSNAKVNNAGFMLGQYELMYRHALGSFQDLLQEMSKDPAMMVWLDISQSKKAMPNENYARELMELFSLGLGNYTEKDIREAARAFTGWEIRERKAAFDARQHDEGDKAVLGQKGKWRETDIARICLEQASAPYFVAGKVVRFLVSETMPVTRELLEPLAVQFRKDGYHIGRLVETVLRSNLFFSPEAYRARVKPPVDFTLGIVRGLEGRIGTTALAQSLEELGQNLFYPPSVKGWDGGAAWLNGQTLLFRQNLALGLTSTEDNRFGRRTDPAVLVRKYDLKSDEETVDFFLKLFLDSEVSAESRNQLLHYYTNSQKQKFPAYWSKEDAEDQRVRTLCHLVLTLPEFQLN